MSFRIRKNRGTSVKEPASRKASGLAHLLTALHQNAAAVVNSKTQLNGPDQILTSDSYATIRRNGCVKLRKEEHGLGSEEPISIPTMLRDISEAYPDTPALRLKRDGVWRTWTYEQYLHDVELVARAFIHLGLHRHHSVAILGSNSPEWVISDLAAVFAGGIAVGMYCELSSEEMSRIAIDSKADIIVVETETCLKRILLVQHKLPELKAIVQIRGEPPLSDKRRLHRTHQKHILSWKQLIEIGQDLSESRLDDRLKRIAINHCCTLVYTSPSTDDNNGNNNGHPKGVMLSHDNLTWCSKMLLGFIRAPGFNRLPSPGEEVLLSFLPHSGIASQTIDIYYTMSIAGTLCFVDADVRRNSEAFFEALSEVRPTVFFGPPEVYERIYHKLRDIRRRMSGVQKVVFDWSASTLRSKHLKGRIPSRLAPARKLSQWRTSVAKNTVCKKHKDLLGFSPRTVFLSRGGPIAGEILKLLAGYDIVIHESFGQCENTGLLTANIPKRYSKLGTVGKNIPGVKTKIAPVKLPEGFFTEGTDYEIGELRGWGRNVFMGYLNREIETKEVFDQDEWLRLGDLGYTDNDEFHVVYGKSENFIRLNTGEFVMPHKIEQSIRLELPCIKHAMVVGDNEGYLAVLLTLATDLDEVSKLPSTRLTEEAQKWFRYDLRTVRDVLSRMDHGLQHLIQAGIDRANQNCRITSHMVREWRLIPNPFTYQNGELALNGKLRRGGIKENHAACIKSLYAVHHGNMTCEAGEPGGVAEDMLRDEAEEAKSIINSSTLQPRQQNLHLQLSQIQEEDESKTSSRTSIDKAASKEDLARPASVNSGRKLKKRPADNEHHDHTDESDTEERPQVEFHREDVSDAVIAEETEEEKRVEEAVHGVVEVRISDDSTFSDLTSRTSSSASSKHSGERKISDSLNSNEELPVIVKERITRR